MEATIGREWARRAWVLVPVAIVACDFRRLPPGDGGDGGQVQDAGAEIVLDTSAPTGDASAPICGNGIREANEQCDEGSANNVGGYGHCNSDCTRGPYCGDDIVNGTDESCDDGQANGLGLDQCNQACTGRVKERSIKTFTQLSIHSGNLTGDWDPFCMTQFGPQYKALLVDGVTRVASKTPYSGDEQVDWVIKPYTRYVNEEGALVWTTDRVALLGVRNGLAAPLLAPLGGTGYAWAGFEKDWTTSALTCGRWSVGSGGGGTALVVNALGIVTSVFDCTYPDLVLLCVEQ